LLVPAGISYLWITGEPSLEFKDFVIIDGVEHQTYHLPSVLRFWLGLTPLFLLNAAVITADDFCPALIQSAAKE
jgi:hypothetical protein